MMAIKQPRYNQKRTPLQDVVPLSTPMSIHIDVSSACNFNCYFCANHSPFSHGAKPYGIMELGVFKKIIDDLSEFDKQIKALRLYNIGEPLINPRFDEMVAYAKQANIAEVIDTTTNGVLMTKEKTHKILDAGLDKICFSIEALNDADYKKITNHDVCFENLLENIKYFYQQANGKCEVHVKTIDAAIHNQEDETKFYHMFEQYCDSMWIDTVVNVWPDFQVPNVQAGKNMYNEAVEPLIVCTQPFYNLSINPDGTVTICDLDWKSEYIIGDVTVQSVYSIWHSQLVRDIQIKHLQGMKSSIPICAKCPWPENGCIDNFDAYRDDVLKRYLEND